MPISCYRSFQVVLASRQSPLPKTRAVGGGCDQNVGWIEIAVTAILGERRPRFAFSGAGHDRHRAGKGELQRCGEVGDVPACSHMKIIDAKKR
jgi:hypothetical protein